MESSAYSGIYAYYYRVDGGEWIQLPGNTLTAAEEGRHVYEFKAESNSTMESYETMQVVQIDTQKPVIRVTFDGTFGRWTSDGVRFNFSTEEESLSGITYYYNDGTGWHEFDGLSCLSTGIRMRPIPLRQSTVRGRKAPPPTATT